MNSKSGFLKILGKSLVDGCGGGDVVSGVCRGPHVSVAFPCGGRAGALGARGADTLPPTAMCVITTCCPSALAARPSWACPLRYSSESM